MVEQKKQKYRWLRRTARILGVLLLVFIVLVLFVRSSWGQAIIVSKTTNYVSEKTNTKVEIERLFITFSGNIALEGLYLEDTKNDTLVYSKFLEANLPITPLLFGNEINLKSVVWEGLRANISRQENSEKFNFDFLLDAFVSQDSIATPTESEPMQIRIGSIDLQDFNINYSDAFLGIESRLKLGEAFLEADKIDLVHQHYALEYLKLSDTEIDYEQTKPFATEEETTETALPILTVENLALTNVAAKYVSIPDATSAMVFLQDFNLKLPKADLEKNDFQIDLLALKNSTVSVQLPLGASNENASVNKEASEGFLWPAFLINVNHLDLENNTINYTLGKNNTRRDSFDPKAVGISKLKLKAKNLRYKPEDVTLNLDELSFEEKSGFQLKNLSFNAALKNTSATVSKLQVSTNSSSLNGSLSLNYPSVEKLLENPNSAAIDLQIPNLKLAMEDAFFFQPGLEQDIYMNKLIQHPFTGNVSAHGTLDRIQMQNLALDWGNTTSVAAQGQFSNITQLDSLSFKLKTIRAISSKKDIVRFVSEKDLGISIPNTIVIDTKFYGDVNNITGNALLTIPEGKVSFTGNYQSKNVTRFNGNLKVDSLRLDKLLKNEQLGGVSFTMDASGSGNSLNSLNAEITSDFSQLTFQNYDFSNLQLYGKIANGEGDIDLNFKDDNLNLTTKAAIDLDSIYSKIGLKLHLIGADLYALGLTREKIRTGFQLKSDLKGNANDFEVKAEIYDGIAVYDNKQYQLGNIDLIAKIDSLQTDFTINSDFLNGFFKSNAEPKRIQAVLTEQFQNYFSDSTQIVSARDSVKLSLDVRLRPTPILTDVFFRDIEQLDSISLVAAYDAMTQKLNAELYVPSAKFAGSAIDSLTATVKGDARNLNFTAGLSSLISEPLHIKRTHFNGNLKNKELLLDFGSSDGDKDIVHIASELSLVKDNTTIHINPEKLILNSKEWSIPIDNEIAIGENTIALRNVVLNRNAQKLGLSTTLNDISKDHLGITFENFKLQTIASLLNPDEALATGIVDGNFIIENPFGARGLVADFKIRELSILTNLMGNLSLNAQSRSNTAYELKLALKDGGVDLDLNGDYAAAKNGAKLNLDLKINRADLKFIEGFSEGAIKDSHGFISGNVRLSGTTIEPQYSGAFNFNKADFNIAAFNSNFRISDETIKIDNNGVFLEQFSIKDDDQGAFTIDGAILTKDVLNPSFDLKLNSEAFKILNSTKEDNELFYGTASLDADINVRGDLELPKIAGRLKIRKITDITYVVPESQLNIEERDGVVLFVDRENPDAILTRVDEEDTPSVFQGMDLQAVLEIANDANFNIIIDEGTGDNLAISGDAALNLNIEPNGRINLSGRYELSDGHYETNLYNLVKRRFEINPGGTITWQGNPLDAKLDITAVYKVETSASSLMSNVISGQDKSVTGKYRQVLPFLVYLNVDGEILEPTLSFGLDMPEEEQGALSGAVYSRVQQLNQQESELNKQVFSLLALNRFYPDSGSDGSSGGTAAIARDNVNKVLSGELNAFSDRIFGNSGFEVDFDLDSFTDYQGDSPQDRTQLNINAKKKLFDERLIVTAGSAVDVEGSAQPGQEETPIIGNVSLEYLITKDGKYRLKGFRKSTYENIIDGQLIVTGLALIFNREFNKFSQLFNPLKEENKADAENIKESKQEKEMDKDKGKRKDEDKKKNQENNRK